MYKKQLKNNLIIGNRSQAEEQVIALLRFHFSHLRIERNNKTAIGKELDIFLPDFNVAIEIDGITHQKAIFGEEKLIKTQKRDKEKNRLAEERNILLLRIALPLNNKEVYEYLKQEIKEIIVPKIIAYTQK